MDNTSPLTSYSSTSSPINPSSKDTYSLHSPVTTTQPSYYPASSSSSSSSSPQPPPPIHNHEDTSIQQTLSSSTPGYCCGIEVSLDRLREYYPCQYVDKYRRLYLFPNQLPSTSTDHNTTTYVAFNTNFDFESNHIPDGYTVDTGASIPTILKVIDAQKSFDGSGNSFTNYVIQYWIEDDMHRITREIKRRYSEFASLRKCLCNLYPTLIVAPIPEKHSFTALATKPSRAKHDPMIIERRKRMLQSFMNRIIWHPILSTEHLVHQFLDPLTMWSNVLASAKVSTLPQTNQVLTPSTTTTTQNSSTQQSSTTNASAIMKSPGHGALAFFSNLTGAVNHNGPHASDAKTPDTHFVHAEAYTLKFETIMKDLIVKSHRKLSKRYLDISNDYVDLSSAYNTLSLNETPVVARAIDKLARAYEIIHASTAVLGHALDETLGDRWHEYVQFTDIIKTVLRYRTELQLSLESTSDMLDAKRTVLSTLERTEVDTRKLSDALRREGYATHTGGSTTASSLASSPSAPNPVVSPPSLAIAEPGASISTTTAGNSNKRTASGIVSALSDRITALLDSDPDATRRLNLAKTRDLTNLLAIQRERQTNELVMANEAIKLELRTYQIQKVKDLRAILVALAKAHADYANKNLKEWQAAREAVHKIPLGDEV